MTVTVIMTVIVIMTGIGVNVKSEKPSVEALEKAVENAVGETMTNVIHN